MSIDENKSVVRRWFEALEQGKAAEVVEELYSPQYVLHDPGAPPDLPPGPQGVLRFVSIMSSSFPGMNITLEDILAEGDRVAIRFSTQGAQLGEFMGEALTGKTMSFEGISIIYFDKGKMVEEWEVVNITSGA